MNGYFSSVFTKPHVSTLPIIATETRLTCDNPEFDTTVVEGYLGKLDINKATGMDEVYSKVLKECKAAIAKTLSLIFNKSAESNKLPKL